MILDKEECRRLIAGLADGELTPEEAMAANECLMRSEECRKEYEQLVATSARLKLLSMKEPEDQVLESLWRAPHHRFAWNAGLWLVIGSLAFLLGYGGYHFFRDLITQSDEPLLPRLAVGGLVVGLVLLFYCVLRERMKSYKVDRYKEIER